MSRNLLSYGAEPFGITVDVQAATVRIEVRDAATDDLPSLRSFDEETAGRRGWHIAERLIRSWGVRREGYGKVVWVEIEVHR
ncbi:MAG TPA: ATP-binding protein [Acidimicrobiales bacterium]|nr:ATP-binding protein [Acidimicrobiales bacterium]